MVADWEGLLEGGSDGRVRYRLYIRLGWQLRVWGVGVLSELTPQVLQRLSAEVQATLLSRLTFLETPLGGVFFIPYLRSMGAQLLPV